MGLPKDPPPGLLMSMAMRYDHGLGMPGFYDFIGPGEHGRRLRSALSTMRQLYEEVSGHGFYSPEHEQGYAALLPSEAQDAFKTVKVRVGEALNSSEVREFDVSLPAAIPATLQPNP